MAEPLSKSEEQTLRDEFKRNFTQGPGPFAEASLLSKLMFGCLTPIIEVSQKVEFTQDLHYKLREDDQSEKISRELESNWRKQHPSPTVAPGTPTPVTSFFKSLWSTFRVQIILGIVAQILQIIMEFSNAALIYAAIELVADIDYSQGLEANKQTMWSVIYIMVWFVFLRILGSALDLWIRFY